MTNYEKRDGYIIFKLRKFLDLMYVSEAAYVVHCLATMLKCFLFYSRKVEKFALSMTVTAATGAKKLDFAEYKAIPGGKNGIYMPELGHFHIVPESITVSSFLAPCPGAILANFSEFSVTEIMADDSYCCGNLEFGVFKDCPGGSLTPQLSLTPPRKSRKTGPRETAIAGPSALSEAAGSSRITARINDIYPLSCHLSEISGF